MEINSSDIEGLKKFFIDNKEMTTHELSRLVDRSASTIRNWKRKCGFKSGVMPFARRPKVEREIKKISDDIDWDDERWFRNRYEIDRLGIPTIAKMLGRSIVLVRGRLEKYGIKVRTHREAVSSLNQHCNREWLEEYYIKRGWSLGKCAIAAGVVPYTICNWLNKFNMEIRDIYEAMAGERNPFWGRTHSEETKAKIRNGILDASGNGSKSKETG